MKTTDLAIIFILITIPFLIITKIKRDYIHYASEQHIIYNRILDTAIEDAITTYKSDQGINREKAVEIFFKTLKVNFELSDTKLNTIELSQYVPTMVSIEKDGFCILSQKVFINEDGFKERRLTWNPKKPYSYQKDDYIYRFFLDNQLEIYHRDLNKFYKGSFESLRNNDDLNQTILDDEEVYLNIKNTQIINQIQRDLNYHINEYNDFSKVFGVTYEFFLPTISNDDWSNSISDVSLLVFFQGIPIGSHGNYYNNYAISGSRLVKKKKYYVIESNLSNKKEYHEINCNLLNETILINSELYESKFEAANSGAFPCNHCQ